MLRRHTLLAFRRSPAYEQSMTAKVMMVLGTGLAVVYMLFGGTMMGTMANDMSLPAFILIMMPLIFLLIDFLFRFVVQKTPAMLVKPYMLLPLPRRSVVETFLFTSLLSGYNWMWLALFLPYTFIIYCGGASLVTSLTVLLSGMTLILANSQFYLLVRTLIARSLLWWILPVVVYGLFIGSLLIPAMADLPISDTMDDVFDSLAEAAAHPLMLLLCLAILGGLLWINRATQYRFALEEISREQKAPAGLKNVSQFKFLENFGLSGEYLKLELKSIMRNKAIRASVIASLTLIVVLTLIIAYTNIYDGRMMLNFWCFYCFAIYGMTTLIKVMMPEGNYIDLLLTHDENILKLLYAKYYFHVAILFVPLVLIMPAIIAGKFSLLMVVSYMLLSSGFLYFLLFQMAVYNKQTLPLDAKITGKTNLETGFQLVISLTSMFSPLVIVSVLVLLFDEQTAYITMAVIGAALTLAHPWWLRNIYNRMMKRKYRNLEGFHATRG